MSLSLHVSTQDSNLLDAAVRLVRLLDAPAEAPVLLPLITREFIYRLLLGEQGDRLRHLAVLRGYTSAIARAVERLRQGFDQPLHIENLAHELGMSVSGFHHHFKAVTAMSPMQFQKQLRLQQARHLMLGKTWTRQARPIASAIKTPPTSVETTKASLAPRPCATSTGCEGKRTLSEECSLDSPDSLRRAQAESGVVLQKSAEPSIGSDAHLLEKR